MTKEIQNIKILNNWYEQIQVFKKLKIKDAKIKYTELLKESDIQKRSKKRQELIQDTLYIPLTFIKRNKEYFIANTQYDMNDIINTIYEIWIELIDGGILLSINSYSEVFNYSSLFYTKLVEKLSLSKNLSESTFILNTNNFSEILLKYLKLKEQYPELTYNTFLDFIKQETNKDEEYYKRYVGYYYLYTTYLLLDSIEDNLKEIDISKLSKTKIDKLKYLILNSGINNLKENIEIIMIPDIEKIVTNRDYNTKVLKILLSNLTERELDIIKRRYGLDEYQHHTLDELSKMNKVTKGRILQIEGKTLRKMRRIAARNKIKYVEV